ncbi:MAG: 4'-phosphopantetheinyl transferase superfamily protein [Lachnospiraceae bacterium]|nr:4'-phosphopantetheinyl transferase superfamily protein [Lachnospiraceae bacterium]
MVSAAKRERIDRYKHIVDYRRSLLGDVLSRSLLAKMTGMDVGELDIAKHFFAKSEYEYITDCPEDETRRRFYEIWTAKEAYSKYGGKGFGIDFGSFEVVKRENFIPL